MKALKWKVIAGISAVFLLGVVCGILVAGILVKHAIHGDGGRLKSHLVNRLDRRLDLDESQRNVVDAEIGQTIDTIMELRKDAQLEAAEVLDETVERISEHLDEGQEEKLREFISRHKKNWYPEETHDD